MKKKPADALPVRPFQVMLTEAERDRLERHRKAQGERSQADVVRGWIAGAVTNEESGPLLGQEERKP